MSLRDSTGPFAKPLTPKVALTKGSPSAWPVALLAKEPLTNGSPSASGSGGMGGFEAYFPDSREPLKQRGTIVIIK